MLTVTPSNVSQLACLHKFNELAVNKRYPPRVETGGNLRFSNILHDAMKRLYDPSGGPPNPGRIALYVQAAMMRHGGNYEDEASRAYDVAKAETILRTYFEQDEDSGYTLGVEVSGVFPIQTQDLTFSLSARLDRVLCRPESPDTLIARDYKIRQTYLQPEQVFVNLAVLRCLYPGYRSYVLEVDGIGSAEIGVDRMVYRSRQLKGVIHLLSDQVRRYANATSYPAEPGEHCMHCPLLPSCQQHEVVGAAELDFTDVC